MKESSLEAPQKASSVCKQLDANAVAGAGGWFRAMRGESPMELIKANPIAYTLAAIIAHRGQYRVGFNRYNLALGEALLGDYKNYGMSERQYRTAKRQLQNWGFATFKATSKGTVGKLIDTRLFAIFRLESDEQNDAQPTDGRRTADEQATDSRRLPRTKEQKNQRTKEQKKSGFLKTESIDPRK